MLEMDTLIVMAMHEEGRDVFDEEMVLYTGVGKINAAYHLTKVLQKLRPERVINLGSAGSTEFSTGQLVNCTEFVQRDMNATALGIPHFQTPFDVHNSPVLSYGSRIPLLPKATCGTGDSFYTGGVNDAFNVVDMEAYVFARICQLEDIPFTCIKYITDGANHEAANDWGRTLTSSAVSLREAYELAITEPVMLMNTG